MATSTTKGGINQSLGSPYSSKLIARTKATWEPYVGRPLSDQEALEIIEAMTGLFQFLERLEGENAQV